MPAVTDAVAARPRGVDGQRREADHPAVDADMVNFDSALGEELLEVTVRQAVAQRLGGEGLMAQSRVKELPARRSGNRGACVLCNPPADRVPADRLWAWSLEHPGVAPLPADDQRRAL